jgi:hypothetical protein
LLWIPDRQRSQHQRVDHTEDGGIRSDTEGERKNRHGREARAAAQYADGITKVLHQVFDEIHTSHVAAFLLALLEAPH